MSELQIEGYQSFPTPGHSCHQMLKVPPVPKCISCQSADVRWLGPYMLAEWECKSCGVCFTITGNFDPASLGIPPELVNGNPNYGDVR